jgi:hypothetical protein
MGPASPVLSYARGVSGSIEMSGHLEQPSLPNQALEPTSSAVTFRADARTAPAEDVAHL